MEIAAAPPARLERLRGLIILVALAAVGLFIVKWRPYWLRSFVIAGDPSHAYPGSSILSGKAAAPPPFSLDAALSYARTYFLAVWQAMLLGLLLAATIETLIPRDWIARVLGAPRFRATALGAALALPGMM